MAAPTEIVDKLREKPVVQKLEKFFPAIAFLGGFGWDSITLGQQVYGFDLFVLFGYYLGALILVTLLSAHIFKKKVLTGKNASVSKKTLADLPSNANVVVVRYNPLNREWSDVWKKRFTWALQFFFGGLFSALVVCYFKSSGSISSLIVVVLMACLLVGNEFLQKKYESFPISLGFFCLLGTMFMNFTIPHLVHQIGFLWFFLSTALSFGICFLIWKVSQRRITVLVPPIIISSLLIFAYLMNWVPPVPLVLKHQLACQNFQKSNYSCETDNPTFWQKIGFKAASVHHKPGTKIYILSSVYAPADLKAEMEYVWYYKDPNTGSYNEVSRISSGRMVINGGRENGFRSYSFKQNIPPGRYRVETAFKNGAVIGTHTFDVFEGESENGVIRDSLP